MGTTALGTVARNRCGQEVLTVGVVGEGTTEVVGCHCGRVGHVVARGFDTEFDPGHQIDEGADELSRGEVTVTDPSNRPLHHQVALAVGRR